MSSSSPESVISVAPVTSSQAASPKAAGPARVPLFSAEAWSPLKVELFRSLYIATSIALILSAVLMLKHLNEGEAAHRVEHAVNKVLLEGKNVTGDLGGTATTTAITEAIIAAL